jgi:SMI1/KNR4 family protein SUKH-1
VARDWTHIAAAVSLQLVTPPPSDAAVGDAERALRARLSASLRDLYSSTDGLVDEWGYAYVLPLDELTQQNQVFRRQFRDLYMPFEGLLLFGQFGNGDMLFQPLVPHDNENVFRWDHEDDSRKWYAADVERAVLRLGGAESP